MSPVFVYIPASSSQNVPIESITERINTNYHERYQHKLSQTVSKDIIILGINMLLRASNLWAIARDIIREHLEWSTIYGVRTCAERGP